MKMPLEGYRVLEWTAWVQGPYAAQILGDLGAEVIKIEDPVMGDPSRGLAMAANTNWGKQQKGMAQRPGLFYDHANRNKKSITVDVKKQRGRELIYELVKKSDVFLQNHRRTVPSRVGLDYATLSKYNPRLIYASGSGWGPKGPDSNRESLDFSGMARSGLLTLLGDPQGPPVRLDAYIADQMGAVMTAFATMTALLMRERTGIGQEVEASLLGSMVVLLGGVVSYKLLTGIEQPRHPRTAALNPLWNIYRCKDDKWIGLALLQPDRYWSDLCHGLELQYLEKDPRFENMTVRGKNAAEMVSILDKVFATKTRAEWLDILVKREHLLCEPINSISDLVEDPQVWANDYLIKYQHTGGEEVSAVGFPIHFSHATSSVRLPVPEFGQHTEEVLRSLLGYSWEDITKLKEEGVI